MQKWGRGVKNAGDTPSLELEKEKFYLIGYTYPKGGLYYAELRRVEENKGVSCSSNATDFCYAQCPNPRAGREKASKTMQFAKREVYC